MVLYRIADLIVEMDVRGRTQQLACPFAIEDELQPDICFPSREQMDENNKRVLTNKPEIYTEVSAVEYVGTGAFFSRRLIDFNGFVLHSSAVVVDGKAYLFSADSGVGKSTHTTLWVKNFEGAHILNDDKPAIRVLGGKVFAYGTPWNGKSEVSRNEKVPLGGICFIKRGMENRIRKLATSKAIFLLLRQMSGLKLKTEQMDKLLSTWNELLLRFPIYELEALPDDAAAMLSYKTMMGDQNEN